MNNHRTAKQNNEMWFSRVKWRVLQGSKALWGPLSTTFSESSLMTRIESIRYVPFPWSSNCTVGIYSKEILRNTGKIFAYYHHLFFSYMKIKDLQNFSPYYSRPSPVNPLGNSFFPSGLSPALNPDCIAMAASTAMAFCSPLYAGRCANTGCLPLVYMSCQDSNLHEIFFSGIYPSPNRALRQSTCGMKAWMNEWLLRNKTAIIFTFLLPFPLRFLTDDLMGLCYTG